MSITIKDILQFPCMRGAHVVAGQKGLDKIVTSVSVLEYSQTSPLQNELFDSAPFYGTELVISAFANIADDVAAQYANVRRMALEGEVGLILYYVGRILPEIAPELITLANELDFPLIVMPEGRLDLRYSEVICEIMEAVVRDQDNAVTLANDLLAGMVRLAENQRTVDNVLRMLRDHIHAAAILVGQDGNVLAQAIWPQSLTVHPGDLKHEPVFILPGGHTVWYVPLESGDLYLIKEGTPLRREVVVQATDVVRLAMNLWGEAHSGAHVSELVRAILRDEPMKMRSIAQLFHIPVEKMHAMWILSCPESRQLPSALCALRENLSVQCNTVVADSYEDCAVAFMVWNQHGTDALGLAEAVLTHVTIPMVTLTCCQQLADTSDTRRAFLLHQKYRADMHCIWPRRQIFTYSHLQFAAECRRAIEAGESTLNEALVILSPLRQEKEAHSLMQTLSVYLLDADASVSRCAQLMNVHKNTVKYRIGRISAVIGAITSSGPERFYLYRAAAIERLLSASGS